MTNQEFLSAIDRDGMKILDRALALLWHAGHADPQAAYSATEIADILESVGFPRQNRTRLHSQLSGDRRTAKAPNERWKLIPKARRELDDVLLPILGAPKRSSISNSVLPTDLFTGTRGYLEKVCMQLNQSYDYGLCDCCAVMCRRLVETLLIEVYEKAGRASEIKGADGNFMMLAGLLGIFENDNRFNPGRATLAALKDFKRLGDSSAHNRRFNAQKNDIDRVRDGLRVAAEDLLHLAAMR